MRRRTTVERAGGNRLLPATMVVAAVTLSVFSFTPIAGRADTPAPTFGATYVSTTLAGGEPFVIYSHDGSDLVYAAHEGTTHTYKNGLTEANGSCDILPPQPGIPSGYACSYNNHINQWYSTDGGATWTLDSSTTNPLAGTQYTGFSDPSLTEDAPATGGGHQWIYDTGIDLANDAVYASDDGGKTWLTGNVNCSEGDRPWLAGGKNGEVFMATDLEAPAANGVSGHAYFHGIVNSAIDYINCDPNAISDPHGGDAQDYYDHANGDIIEGAQFPDGGMGIGVLPNASNAWAPSSTNTGAATGAFVDHEGTVCKGAADPNLCTQLGPIFPEIALDSAGTVYVVWATNPRSTQNGNGCSATSNTPAAGGPAILPNTLYMMYTKNFGTTWSTPEPIATPTTSGGTTLLWPFITAGSAGNVAVAWYQSNQLTDPDCDSASLLPGGQPTQWTLHEATIYGVGTATYPPPSVNAVPATVDGVVHPGGVLHIGGICQSGTTCVATGQDRRLGDYFTDALDQNGCVMIATGDTMITQNGAQLAWSRPLFLQQASGHSLTNPNYTCATKLSTGPSSSTPETPVVPGLVAAGVLAGGAALVLRRRRRRGGDVTG